MMFLITLVLLNSINSAANAADCRKLLTIAVNNSARFTDPQMPRLIPLRATREMYLALNSGQCRFGPAILQTTIKTPVYLSYLYTNVSVTVRLENSFAVDSEALGKTAERMAVINPDAHAWISIDLGDADYNILGDAKESKFAELTGLYSIKGYAPVLGRVFVEQFLRRSAIYAALKRSAKRFAHSEILTGNRVSKWAVDPMATNLNIYLDGLTQAEFAAVLNDLATYLDGRAER